MLSLKAFEAHAGNNAQACLNSATHGGEDLGQLAEQPDLTGLRIKVEKACSNLAVATVPPSQPSNRQVAAVRAALDDLVADIKAASAAGVRTGALAGAKALAQATINAAAAFPGLSPPASSPPNKRARVDNAVSPLRLVHLAKDVPLDECLGKSTFWGSLAGPGPTIIRKALDWARGGADDDHGCDDFTSIASLYGGFVDLWPISSFHTDSQLTRMSEFVCEIFAELGRPDIVVAHSSKVCALLEDGAFGKRGPDCELLQPFRSDAASITDDPLWESLQANPIVACAGDVSLVEVGPFVRVPAFKTPDFGVVKYDPRFRVPYLRLSRLLALKQRVLAAAVQSEHTQG